MTRYIFPKEPIPQTCSQNIEDEILSLADGEFTDSERESFLRKHLTECAYCRNMYISYINDEEDHFSDTTTGKSLPGLIISYLNGIMRPITGQTARFEPVFTLSSEKEGNDCAFTIDENDFPANITLSSGKNHFTVTIKDCNKGKTAYLIRGDDVQSMPIRKGTAQFNFEIKGAFLISIDMKSFLSISVQ